MIIDNKILVLLLYYERPNLVKNALNSILKANEHYKNWFLVIHDDGSDHKVEPIVHSLLDAVKDRVGIIRSEITTESKINEGGMLGRTINDILRSAKEQLKPDVACLLCDDDEVHPLYFKNLNQYFNTHPDVMSCYSNVICYNPLEETSDQCDPNKYLDVSYKMNQWTLPMCGADRVDASQVAWRMRCHDMGAWFPYPCMKNHDSGFFHALNHCCGPMHYTGFVSQYKGVHPKQLGLVGSFHALTKKDIDKHD